MTFQKNTLKINGELLIEVFKPTMSIHYYYIDLISYLIPYDIADAFIELEKEAYF